MNDALFCLRIRKSCMTFTTTVTNIMATQQDVREIALALPETSEASDRFAFTVNHKGKQKGFVWVWLERIQPKKARVPNPDVIALRVANLDEKDFLLAAQPDKFFTEPHYNGFPAILLRLPKVDRDELSALILNAWSCQAPAALVKQFKNELESREEDDGI